MEYIGDSHAIISGYIWGFLKMEDPQATMGFNTKNPSMFNDLGYPHFSYDHWDSLMIFPYTSDYDSGHMDYNGWIFLYQYHYDHPATMWLFHNVINP